MTRTAGSSQARKRLSEPLDRVAAGESFVITRHGEPIARLVPARPKEASRSVDEIIAAARELRREVEATDAEIRSWIDQGRA